MLAVPKEALCLVGIILWDFRRSPVARLILLMLCVPMKCVLAYIVDIFTYFMKLPI